MVIWKRPSSSLITLQDTPNMEEFALSQGWVKNDEVKKQESKKAKKKRN